MNSKQIAILFILSITFFNCNRKDFYIEKELGKATITLNGDSLVNINFGDTYIDPSATAKDSKGNNLVVTIDNNGFNSNLANSYSIVYSATDAEGNTLSTTRTVNVNLQQSNWTSSYSVQSGCKYSIPNVPLPVNFFRNSADIVAGSGANTLELQNIDFARGNTVFYATINGTNISITGSLSISPAGLPSPFTYEFTGTGTISENAQTITVDYIWENTTPIIGGNISSCIAIYTKN